VPELGEPEPLVGQPPGQIRRRPQATGGQQLAGRPDRQRQVIAVLDDGPDRGRPPRGMSSAGRREERRRVLGFQRGQVDGVHTGHARYAGAGGHQDRTRPAAGQQRHELAGGGHIVQHDEQRPVRRPAAEGAYAAFQAGRDEIQRRTRVVQDRVQHIGGIERPVVTVAQVGVQLAVREPVLQRVRGVDREGGLARSGRAEDDDEPGRGPGPVWASE
jgi:hypothetical protein